MPVLPKYPSASAQEIEELKKLVKKIPTPLRKPPLIPPTFNETVVTSEAGPAPTKKELLEEKKLFTGALRNIEVKRQAYNIDNPVSLLLVLKPNLTPYKWQFEELMQVAGYITPGDFKKKTPITKEFPFQKVLAAANGSGKDMIYIACIAVWYAMTGARNRCIITSSSFDQVKYQTEPSILELINQVNLKFGKVFKSVQFHHVIPELGSEIKLFATDDPGHAEGYHSWDSGGVCRIVNEAKTVSEDLFSAMDRWTGVTHNILVSSPGKKSGYLYKRATQAINFPNPLELGKYHLRKVTAMECPHISAAHIKRLLYEHGENSPLVQSAIYANFSDFDEPVVITEYAFDKLLVNPPKEVDNDIGIGLDLAGGGDEDACFVRRGNRVIHSFFFRQKDTDLAADYIDSQLMTWKASNYSFNADNGGIGQAIIDKLASRGWSINRRNNQSPAFNKKQFLNLGAEMWYKVKRFIERQDIILPITIKLREQLTSRQWGGAESNQGKFFLESKKEAIASGRPSPDRGDAFVLCFYSYSPGRAKVDENAIKTDFIDSKALLAKTANGFGLLRRTITSQGRFTLLNNKV